MKHIKVTRQLPCNCEAYPFCEHAPNAVKQNADDNGQQYPDDLGTGNADDGCCEACGGNCDAILSELKAELAKPKIEKGSMEAALGGFPDYNTSRAYYAGNE
ncbi:MAG: hypothetical protein ACRDQZ_11805 [Mycobacteriales bacterium]